MKNIAALVVLVGPSAAFGVPRVGTRSSAIVGGQSARIEDFPYQANVFVDGDQECGGSIINKHTIVTAAHCVYTSKAPSVTVRVGSDSKYGGTSYKVKTLHIHPKWSHYTLDYDIAVLTLVSDLTFGSTIQPITLVSSTSPAGAKATVSGWGDLGEDGPGTDSLRSVVVPIVDKDECKRDYSPGGYIRDRQTCAGYKEGGKSSCSGDSGGPLAVGGQLAGIVSFQTGCAQPNLPGVYTDIGNSEIHQYIIDNS